MTINREKRRLLGPMIAGGVGLVSLVSGFDRPGIANMRTVDLVHLLATGACLGVAAAAVVMYLVRRRTD